MPKGMRARSSKQTGTLSNFPWHVHRAEARFIAFTIRSMVTLKDPAVSLS